jgi:hypothetical protein
VSFLCLDRESEKEGAKKAVFLRLHSPSSERPAQLIWANVSIPNAKTGCFLPQRAVLICFEDLQSQ